MKSIIGKINNFYQNIVNKVNAFFLRHDKLNRLKTLTMMQMKNPKRLFKPIKFTDKLLIALFKIGVFVGLFFILKVLLNILYSFTGVLLVPNYNKDVYLRIFFLVYIAAGVITESVKLVSVLYHSSDNQILLGYPVKANDIYISKMIVQLTKEYKKAIWVIIPFSVAFMMVRQKAYSLTWTFILAAVILFLVIPILVLAISGVLSILFSFLDTLFKRFGLIKIIFFGLLTLGVFVGVIILVCQLKTSLPIRQLWYNTVDDITGVLKTIGNYTFLSRMCVSFMFGEIWYAILVILGITLAFVLINIFVCYRFFFYLIYQPIHQKKISIKRKTKLKQSKNAFTTFFKKEVKTFANSENGFLSSVIYVLIMPLILFTMNRIFYSFDLSTKGYNIITTVNIMVSITLLSAANIQVSNALSSEGSEFYLLKVSPINTKQIALAKILISVILTFFSCCAMFAAIKVPLGNYYSFGNVFLICLVSFMYACAHILKSFEFDLMSPKVKQVMAGEKDNNNYTKSIFLGVGYSLLAAFTTYFFLYMYERTAGFRPTPWASIVIIAALLLATRIYLFYRKVDVYFDEITF